MKNIEEMENELKELINKLKVSQKENLFQTTTNNDNYIKLEHEDNAIIADELQSSDDNLWSLDFENNYPLPIEQERKDNVFYYTITDKVISYEIGKDKQKIKFTNEDSEKINYEIFLHALDNGHLGIFKDIHNIKKILMELRGAQSELEVKKLSSILNAYIQNYNNNLQNLEKISGKELPNLKINNSLLPLPQLFDTRLVQVASHAPGREGTYRRSQVAHPYHQTDDKGVEIILKTENEFSNSLPNSANELFLTVKKNEIVYYDLDKEQDEEAQFKKFLEKKEIHQNLVYKKDGKFFIRDIDIKEKDIELTEANQEEINKIEQGKIIQIENFKQLFNNTEQIPMSDTSVEVKKTNGQPFLIHIAQNEKNKIITKIDKNIILTNDESQTILNAIKEKTGEIFTLKYELNNFGDRIVESVAEKGETYNVGGNASRVDKVIQYTSNQISSIKNNKSLTALKDNILDHKNGVVSFLVENLKSKTFEYLNVSDDQLKAKYPCLIITFSNINFFKEDNNPEIINLNNSPGSIPEGYSDFVTHMMVAQINLKLKEKNLFPLIDRRQSFGFLTPTLTDVHTGVRLSPGLTPNQEWIDCAIAGIEETDKILKDLVFKKEEDKLFDKFRGGIFSGRGYEYFQTLYQKAKDNSKEDINQFLDAKKKQISELSILFLKESASQKEQNEIKQRFKNDKKFTKLYKFDEKNNIITCYTKGEDSSTIDRYKVDKDKINYFLLQDILAEENIILTEIEEEWLLEAIEKANPDRNSIVFKVDTNYKVLYKEIMSLYKKILNQDDIVLSEQFDLEKATRELISTQEQMVEFLLKQTPLSTEDTSDEESNDKYAKKNYYSPAGMSALFAPLTAARQMEKDNYSALPFPYGSDKYAYFELGLSWNKTLGKNKFIRSDLVEEKIKNSIFKNLLKSKILLKEDKDKNSFFQKIIDDVYNKKLLEGDNFTKEFLIESANEILARDYKDSEILNEKALQDACQIIFESFPPYLNQKDIEKINHPIVYYVDNNPCVNKNTEKVQTALEILTKLCEKEPYPKIFVLDITSSTKEQVRKFLEEFNKQAKIPVLVTASSMVKHSELGLDLWQGGENKAYLSTAAKSNKENELYFQQFSLKLKEITQGTESGLGRYARRLLRETFNSMKNESSSRGKEKTSIIKSKLTKGEGDCFFHASFGNENNSTIEDQAHAEHRKILISEIKKEIVPFLEKKYTRDHLLQIVQELWLTRWSNEKDPERERLQEIYQANSNSKFIDDMKQIYEKFIVESDDHIFNDFIKFINTEDKEFFHKFRETQNRPSINNNDKTCLHLILNDPQYKKYKTQLDGQFSEKWQVFIEKVNQLHLKNDNQDIAEFFIEKIPKDQLEKLCELSLEFFDQAGIFIDYHFSAFMPIIFKDKFSDGFVLERKTKVGNILEHYTINQVKETDENSATSNIYYNGLDHYEQSNTPKLHEQSEKDSEAILIVQSDHKESLGSSLEQQRKIKEKVVALKNNGATITLVEVDASHLGHS